jgi:PTS system mannose-specific IIA component
MIGILIICHREMGIYIKDTAVNIFGKSDYFEALSIMSKDGVEISIKKIEYCLSNWKELDGILVFVDMFGGTPCNLVARILKKYKDVDVITGVNLPMVLEALSIQNKYKNIREMVKHIISKTHKMIFNLRKLDIFKE